MLMGYYYIDVGGIYHVGCDDAGGIWHLDSEWRERHEAGERAHWLNGGDGEDKLRPTLSSYVEKINALRRRLAKETVWRTPDEAQPRDGVAYLVCILSSSARNSSLDASDTEVMVARHIGNGRWVTKDGKTVFSPCANKEIFYRPLPDNPYAQR